MLSIKKKLYNILFANIMLYKETAIYKNMFNWFNFVSLAEQFGVMDKSYKQHP